MTRPSYTFGTWKLDCNAGALSGEAGIVALRPKSFEVLLFLIQNSGNLVSRDAILAAVWPNVIVTEESLTQCVSELRRAMDDTDQRIIKTVPKRGYLFAAQVLTLGSGDAERQALSAQQPLINEQSAQSGSHLPVRNLIEGPSVAVLPFANLSGDADQEYLSDGITEDVINGLSRFRDLSVIARNSTFGYKGKSFDVREIGQQLGVRYLVEGSVRRFGERIRITAQLIDAQSGVQRWSERFDRALGDIFDVQDEITRSIVAIVVAHLNSAEIERTAAKPAGSWTAYDLTL
ncbi:MAG: winged helix-turn-helix domain-containing protein, partial [Beijerinckiaceae bacterium]